MHNFVVQRVASKILAVLAIVLIGVFLWGFSSSDEHCARVGKKHPKRIFYQGCTFHRYLKDQ